MGACVIKSSTPVVRIETYGQRPPDGVSNSEVPGTPAVSQKTPSPVARTPGYPPVSPPKIILKPIEEEPVEGYPTDERRAASTLLLPVRGHNLSRTSVMSPSNPASPRPDYRLNGIDDVADVVASLRREVADLQRRLEAEKGAVARLQAELAAAKGSPPGPERQRLAEKDWVKGPPIGTGAHGSVFMAMNCRTGELMATKQITLTDPSGQGQADQELVLSFKREVNVLLKLEHQNVVRYIHHQKVGTVLTVFQEYISGGSLESLLKQFGAFHEPVICRYSQQMFQGLGYLHSQDIIHRDVKGANVLVTTTGVVKLADFGTAKTLKKGTNSLQGPFAPHGSPFWLAPEVLKGISVSKASDVWSAACVIIEMATAEPPWREWSNLPVTGIIYRISNANRPPSFPGHLSGLLQDLLGLCLSMRPEDRQPAGQVLQHLWFTSGDKKGGLGAGRRQGSLRSVNSSAVDSDDFRKPFEGSQELGEDNLPLIKTFTAASGLNPNALFRKSSVMTRLRGPAACPSSPSNLSFTSSVNTLQQTALRYRCPSTHITDSVAIGARLRNGAVMFADDVRLADGQSEYDGEPDGEEEVSISIHTIDLALRWLSRIKDVLPLEEYLKKAEDYEEYGAFVGHYLDDLENESQMERMETQIVGENASMLSHYEPGLWNLPCSEETADHCSVTSRDWADPPEPPRQRATPPRLLLQRPTEGSCSTVRSPPLAPLLGNPLRDFSEPY